MIWIQFLFFFASRRLHTRWPPDWSSDVCSSDLGQQTDVIIVDTYNHKNRPDTNVASQAKFIVQKLGRQLKNDPHFKKVTWGFPSSAASPKLIRDRKSVV